VRPLRSGALGTPGPQGQVIPRPGYVRFLDAAPVVFGFRQKLAGGRLVAMEEAFRYVLGGLAVISLAAIALYVLVFASVVVATLLGKGDGAHDAASEELDRCLVALLGEGAAGTGDPCGTSRRAARS
jgi:hypothetical protein